MNERAETDLPAELRAELVKLSSAAVRARLTLSEHVAGQVREHIAAHKREQQELIKELNK